MLHVSVCNALFPRQRVGIGSQLSYKLGKMPQILGEYLFRFLILEIIHRCFLMVYCVQKSAGAFPVFFPQHIFQNPQLLNVLGVVNHVGSALDVLVKTFQRVVICCCSLPMQQVGKKALSRHKGFGSSCDLGRQLPQIDFHSHRPQKVCQKIVRIVEMRKIILDISGRCVSVQHQRIGNLVVHFTVYFPENRNGAVDFVCRKMCGDFLQRVDAFPHALHPFALFFGEFQLPHLIPVFVQKPLPVGFMLVNRRKIPVNNVFCVLCVFFRHNIPDIPFHCFPGILQAGFLVLELVGMNQRFFCPVYLIRHSLGIVFPDGLHCFVQRPPRLDNIQYQLFGKSIVYLIQRNKTTIKLIYCVLFFSCQLREIRQPFPRPSCPAVILPQHIRNQSVISGNSLIKPFQIIVDVFQLFLCQRIIRFIFRFPLCPKLRNIFNVSGILGQYLVKFLSGVCACLFCLFAVKIVQRFHDFGDAFGNFRNLLQLIGRVCDVYREHSRILCGKLLIFHIDRNSLCGIFGNGKVSCVIPSETFKIADVCPIFFRKVEFCLPDFLFQPGILIVMLIIDHPCGIIDIIENPVCRFLRNCAVGPVFLRRFIQQSFHILPRLLRIGNWNHIFQLFDKNGLCGVLVFRPHRAYILRLSVQHACGFL